MKPRSMQPSIFYIFAVHDFISYCNDYTLIYRSCVQEHALILLLNEPILRITFLLHATLEKLKNPCIKKF
jgi:hypothetical protein